MQNPQTDDTYDAAQPDPRKPGRPPRDGVAASGHLHIRTTLHRHSAWVRAAGRKPLSVWVTTTLDRAARYEAPLGK